MVTLVLHPFIIFNDKIIFKIKDYEKIVYLPTFEERFVKEIATPLREITTFFGTWATL